MNRGSLARMGEVVWRWIGERVSWSCSPEGAFLNDAKPLSPCLTSIQTTCK